MSTIKWAESYRCDYPGCQSVASVTDGEPAAGWVHLYRYGVMPTIEIRDPRGMTLADFCTIHAVMTVRQLAEHLRIAPAPEATS